MIEKFINNFKKKHKDLEYLFTNGLCYQFTCILDKIFVGSIMYNDIDNHFAFLHNGKLYDIGMLSRFCADKSLFFVIDAISSYLADDINFNKYNVDALIVSSQKALALAPGISIVQVSEKLYEERIDGKETRTFYFDFYSHIKNLERGQTPFTPAVGILLELNQRLKQIDSIGVAEVVEHRKKMANMLNFQKMM